MLQKMNGIEIFERETNINMDKKENCPFCVQLHLSYIDILLVEPTVLLSGLRNVWNINFLTDLFFVEHKLKHTYLSVTFKNRIARLFSIP